MDMKIGKFFQPDFCVKISTMDRRSHLLYQIEPAGLALKILFITLPLGFLAIGVYLWLIGEVEGAITMLSGAVIMGLIFWSISPRRYEIYDSYLRIALGGPLGINIGFDEIETVEATARTALTVNFVTTFAITYVRIVKKNGMDIAITPKSNEAFVQNANQALERWKISTGRALKPFV